jgi:hypothetical protein
LTLKRFRVTTSAVEKQLIVTYSEYVSVALFIQHAKRMGHDTFSSVAFPVLPYFSTLSHKWCDFRGKKKIIEREMCALTSSTTFV